MNRVCGSLWGMAALLCCAGPSFGQDDVVNGYTYLAPSVYLAPPIVAYDRALVIPSPYVIQPAAYAPVAVVPYDFPLVYAPVRVAPTAVWERVRFGRYGVDYKQQTYVPGRAAPIYTLRVDPDRRGVRVRERYR